MLFSLCSAFSQTDDIAKPFNTIEEYDEFTNTTSIGITGEVLDEQGNALLFALEAAKLDGEINEEFIANVNLTEKSDASDKVYFLTTSGDRFSFIGQAAENELVFSINSKESLYKIFSKKGTRFRFEEQVYTITDKTGEYIHKQITSLINPEKVENFVYKYDSYKSKTGWNKLNPNKPRVDFRIVKISYLDSVYRRLEDMERLPKEIFGSNMASFEVSINTKGNVVKVNGNTNVDDWKNWKFSESDIEEVTSLDVEIDVESTVEISGGRDESLSPYELTWEGELTRDPRVQPLPINRTNTDATITIRFEVNPDGSIGRTLPIQRMNPELEQEVMRSLRNWRFNPLSSNEPQETQWGTITFRFYNESTKTIELPAPDEDEEDFFTMVENMPELIGGLAGLQESVTYPEMARKAGIEGRVFLQFIVNERGEVEDPRVIRGIGGGCDEEALKAIQKAKFKPGLQRGRPVRVQYNLPVVFKLEKNQRRKRGS